MPFVIDHSSLALFKECPRKYYYGILQGYRPKTAAPPLVFGSVYHDALEHYDRERAKGTEHDAAIASAIRKAWAASADPSFTLDNRRSRETLIRAIIWYADTYKNDPTETVLLADGRPAVELSFRVELPFVFAGHEDEPVIYCGHIDRVVRYNDKLYALEHKHTISGLHDSYWDRYLFSNQISGYVLALRTQFNLDTAGAIIDATQVGVNFARFGRRFASRVEAHQQEWITDLAYWLSQLDLCLRSENFPHNTESCTKYGGCQFRSVCFSNPLMRETVLDTEFKIEKWDPLRVRGEEA